MSTVQSRFRQAMAENPDITSMADLARRAGQEPGTVRKYFDQGPDFRHPPLDKADELGQVLGYRGRWLREGRGPKYLKDELPLSDDAGKELSWVKLIDMVTAGKLANPNSQIAIENVPLLAFADLGSGDFFATRVVGNSMDRISPEGSIIVVDRADKTPVNGKCYVFSIKGATTYKRWQGGEPSYLEPYSTDAENKPIFIRKNMGLVIVGRVKRTTLDL